MLLIVDHLNCVDGISEMICHVFIVFNIAVTIFESKSRCVVGLIEGTKTDFGVARQPDDRSVVKAVLWLSIVVGDVIHPIEAEMKLVDIVGDWFVVYDESAAEIEQCARSGVHFAMHSVRVRTMKDHATSAVSIFDPFDAFITHLMADVV